MTLTPEDNQFTAIEAPLTFLALRGSLVSQRRVAKQLGLTDLLGEIDPLLAETEAATRTLLLKTPMPDHEYLDPIFDEEFLTLCQLMGVNVLAWVNQPQILARLRDPDAILSRWVATAEWNADGVDAAAESTISYSESIAEIKDAIHTLFRILLDSGLI